MGAMARAMDQEEVLEAEAPEEAKAVVSQAAHSLDAKTEETETMKKARPKVPEEVESRPRSKVAFTVQGKDLDLDKISQTLGLKASHTHKLGDLISKASNRQYEHDMWSLDSPLGRLEPMDKHLKWWAEHLKPHHDFIQSLKGQAEVYVYCGYTFHDFESGFSFSPEALAIFTDLGIPLEMSLLIG